jgi:Protein of unknown function (DUF2628)
MAVYTVHAPLNHGVAKPTADRIVFVRDGFYIWAALAAALWLIFNRLWLALVGYVVAMLVVTGVLWLLPIGSDVRTFVMVLIALLMGFEAASLKRWTLSRGKWRQLDVVVAQNRNAAERRFFDRWIEGETAAGGSASIDRGSPPPARPLSRGASHGEVMGLFPEPGTPR